MVSEVEQQIIDGVERDGWFAVNYVPGPGDPKEWFTYTVGLARTAGWPEIICFGLNADQLTGMLRQAIGELWHREIRPAPGVELAEVLEGITVRLEQVDAGPKRYFAMADWYAEHSGSPRPERLQLVWPDRDGRFPDDPECDPRVRELQTPKAA